MNKLVQIKRITALCCVFGIVPLCAMENKPNRRSPRLAEKRLALERKLHADAVARGKVNEKKRRMQTELAYDEKEQSLKKKSKTKDSRVSLDEVSSESDLDHFMLRPIMAEGFRKVVEKQRTGVTDEEFLKAIGRYRERSTTDLSITSQLYAHPFDAAMLRPITIGGLAKVIYKDSDIMESVLEPVNAEKFKKFIEMKK